MRKISRQISLESFKSRVPSVLDAYKGNPTILEIDSKSDNFSGDTTNAVLLQMDLSGLTNESLVTQGNYGKIPRNIVLPNDIEKKRNYSWTTIAKIHKFYKDYYNLLMSKDGCRNTPYSSAIEYYNYNILPNDIKGNLKSSYEELDNIFGQYNAETSESFIFEQCYNEVKIPWGKKFVYNKTEFTLPYELYYEWNCLTMYYTTIVKWLAWFEERYYKYNYDAVAKKELQEINCSDSDNCCDCAEYLRLGGVVMYKWLSSINLKIEVEYIDASITLPIFLGNTIDDLGEMSNMAEYWEPGVDYSNTLNNSGGTVVSYLDNDWMIKGSGFTGTEYNDDYKEMYFGNLKWDEGNCLDGEYVWDDELNGHWVRRINEYYKNDKTKHEFILSGGTSGNTYAYKDGVYINSPQPSDMTDTYDIDTNNGNGYCVINDILYPIESIKYVKFVSKDKFLRRNNGKLYEVYQHGESYYTIVDGVTYYSENISGTTQFTFGKIPCGDSGNTSPMEEGKFIRYKNGLFQVDNCGYVQIDAYRKHKTIYGYFTTKTKDRYYVSGYTNTSTNDFTLTIVKPQLYEELTSLKLHSWSVNNQTTDKYCKIYDWVEWKDNPLGTLATSKEQLSKGEYWFDTSESKDSSDSKDFKIDICPKYDEYNKDYISGKTESKLSSLRVSHVAKDDLSSQLPGMFQREALNSIEGEEFLYSNTYVEFGKFPFKKPTQNGDWLDSYYQVGNVSNIEVIQWNDNGNPQYYWGNLLHSMEFYYEDITGNKIQETSVLITTDSSEAQNELNIDNIKSGLTYHYSYSGSIEYDFSVTTQIDKTLTWLPTISGSANLLPFATNVSGNTFTIIGKSGISGETPTTSETSITSGTSITLETSIDSTISGTSKVSGIPISSLDAINLCNILHDIYKVNNITNGNINETMKCKINYNIGAIFSGSSPIQYQLCSDKHKGVEYSEILDVVPNTCTYNIDEWVQLELNYYDFIPKVEKITMQDYDNAKVDTRMADFKVQISYWKGDNETNNTKIFSGKTDDSTYFDPMNDMTSFPVIRRECCLGFSSMESIKGDIYIDRGVARAFDSHLKMGEVKSFEALENYGNGAFRIEIS